MGDFNGDGAQDMALVLANGEVWLFPRKVSNGKEERFYPASGAVVSLPIAAPTPGPLNVLAYNGKRLLGAWSVRAGAPGTIIGLKGGGEITLRWSLPGRQAQERKVQVKTGPVPVSLEGKP